MFKRFGICALTVTLLAGARVHADATSDIKEAGKNFITAFTDGDVAKAKKYALTDEKSEKFLDLFADLNKANKKLVDAAVSKFGDAGNSITNSAFGMARKPQVIQSIDNAKIEVDGDTAIATPENGKPTKMKKDGGKWKVDLTNMSQFENIDKQGPLFQKMAEANAKSAQEISDGKYQTLDDAKAGVRQNMMAAIRSMMPAR